jgi:hypothetical protein
MKKKLNRNIYIYGDINIFANHEIFEH